MTADAEYAAQDLEREMNDGDVFTLIGHAEALRMQGQEDMPDYFWRLAVRIARTIGDSALEARVRSLTPNAEVKGGGA